MNQNELIDPIGGHGMHRRIDTMKNDVIDTALIPNITRKSDRQHRCERGSGGDGRGGRKGPPGQSQDPPGFGEKEEDNSGHRARHRHPHCNHSRPRRRWIDLM